MSSEAAWRTATPLDLDVIMAIQEEVHGLLPERREVFADKMRLFDEGCLVLDKAGSCLGYGIAHPWQLGTVTPLDTLLGALPAAPDCLFIHDAALLPQARGRGAGGAFVQRMHRVAHARGWAALALVSVYGTYPVWERCGFRIVTGMIPPEKLTGYGENPRYMTAAVGQGMTPR